MFFILTTQMAPSLFPDVEIVKASFDVVLPSKGKEDVIVKKECGKCRGERGRYRNKPKGTYIGLFGSSREWIRCDVCNGTGINPDYRSKQCRNCWNTIEYSARTDSSKVPDLCPSCREKARNEKSRAREARQNQPRRDERRYDSRHNQASNWQEKYCPGIKGAGYCGKTIKYLASWSRIPDLCPDCIAKIKAIKAERDANTLTGRCEKCGGETRYNKQYKPPRFCKKCKDEREASKRTKPCQHCGKEVVYYVGEKEHDFCRDCNSIRVYVDKQGSTLQAKQGKNGPTLFTFGRCQAPREDRHGGDADRRREWANRGYYWVTMGGNPHETFIIDQNPVVNGFIQQRQHIDTSYSTASLRDGWKAMAIAVLGLND